MNFRKLFFLLIVMVFSSPVMAQNCYVGGVTTLDGKSRTFYRKSLVKSTWGVCSDYSRVRTCKAGILSGGEKYLPTGEYFDKSNCVSDVTPKATLDSVIAKKKWQLVWTDEFNGDLSKWSKNSANDTRIEKTWLGGYRTISNAVVNQGILKIFLKKGNRTPWPEKISYRDGQVIKPSVWESAHLISTDSFNKGYFEARIKYSIAGATDHAFWLMPIPVGPEIDIVEGFYKDNYHDVVTNTLHARPMGSAQSHLKASSGTQYKPIDLSADFHVFGIEWTDTKVTWYLDGVKTHEVNLTTQFTIPAAFGGGYAKIGDYFKDKFLNIRLSTLSSTYFTGYNAGKETDISANGSFMAIDYVRVFKERP